MFIPEYDFKSFVKLASTVNGVNDDTPLPILSFNIKLVIFFELTFVLKTLLLVTLPPTFTLEFSNVILPFVNVTSPSTFNSKYKFFYLYISIALPRIHSAFPSLSKSSKKKASNVT